MKVLVIGGTSFIGPYVIKHLVNMGHKVNVFHRGKTEADLPSEVEHILGNRKNLHNFKDKFKEFNPDIVLDMFPINEQDAKDIVDCFKSITKRIVAISSQDVYLAYGKFIEIEDCPIQQMPLTEESPLRKKLYPYKGKFERYDDYDKILIEQVIMNEPNLSGTILRLPMVYGPGDYQHRFFEYIKHIEDKRPFILLDESFAKWKTTFGYVENVAYAIALAISNEQAANHIYNIGYYEHFTTLEWVEKIGKIMNWDGKIVIAPKGHISIEGCNPEQHLFTDTSLIRKELDYKEQIPLNETIKNTIAWELKNPPPNADKMFDYTEEDNILAELGF